MKLTIVLILQLIISMYSESVRADVPRAPVSIRIEAPKNQYHIGDRMAVLVIIRNISKKNIELTEPIKKDQAQLVYKMNVEDKNGISIKPKRDFDEISMTSAQIVQLKPGEEMSSLAVVNSFYSLNRSGVYKVEFSRLVPNGTKDILIYSNPIYVSLKK